MANDDNELLLLHVLQTSGVGEEDTVELPSLVAVDDDEADPEEDPRNKTLKPTTQTRRRVKEELEYLREQVQELKQQLDALKQSPAPPAYLSDSRGSHAAWEEAETHTASQLSLHTVLWKRVAERQLDAKERAEAENAKLRHMLEGQLRIAQSLAKVLRKRSDSSWLESNSAAAKRARLMDSSDADAVFAALSDEVETLSNTLEATMLDAGLGNVTQAMEGGVIKTNAGNGLLLEVVHCNVVPFDFHRTGAAVWKLLSSLSVAIPNGVYQAIDVTDNLLRAQFSVTMPFRRLEAVLNVRVVCKRIVEEHREVLVWCSDGHSEGSLLGAERMGIHERSWSVVEPVGSCGAAAIIKSVVHTTSTLSASPRRSSANERTYRIGVFTDVVLSSFHRNLAALHQQLENLLVSEEEGLSRELD
ncbi:hypothetical protein PybrP1_011603 [[Pythium] brassicae (nom. inval.)]|nr:hypothetical protein PybrP1_011603 [[Pythium] brassicae (nom. inval.)]